MQLHSQGMLEDNVVVILDDRRNDHSNVLPEIQYECGRSWPQNIFIHQKLDDGKYATRFPVIPPLVCRNANTKILWIMVSLLSRSKLIWKIIDRKKSPFRETVL